MISGALNVVVISFMLFNIKMHCTQLQPRDVFKIIYQEGGSVEVDLLTL